MILHEDAEIARRSEVVQTLDGFVEENLDLLKPVEDSWQPSDFLPDLTLPDWKEKVDELRETSRALSNDVLVVLVGDMVTEEALPSYQTWTNRFAGMDDKTGTDKTGWARWTRGWTAEENRHGDLLNRFLYLMGRVDIRSIEVTIHHLLKNGFDTRTGDDPYKGFVYTSFQERATKISHQNVANLARQQGDPALFKMCSMIAGDETRHETAYKRFMGRVFKIDPAGAIHAFYDVMKKQVAMPAALMDDGKVPDLFDKFSAVAQRLGVYTAHDYAAIIDHLVKTWDISVIQGLSGEFARMQDALCTMSERYHKLADRMMAKFTKQPIGPFSWIFNESV
ncbi:MAG: acyl-ACP desaturase [Candidatus Sumerlaeaceae bacterium]|nr:acyl-ACP desaturase [Candidatus Sumerlaeaceae bacterium]